MGAEPLGWIGAEFVIISIIHTGAALLLKKENGIKNTRNHGKIKYEMWQNSSETSWPYFGVKLSCVCLTKEK